MPRPDAEPPPPVGSAPSQDRIDAQRMEAIRLLVPGVAHEFNNEMASILAVSQNLRTDPSVPPALREQAELLYQEGRRTHRTVNRLLELARRRSTDRSLASLRGIVDEVLEVQSHAFSPGRVEAIVEIPDDLPDMPIDRAEIEQVLVHLTSDAARAIQAGSGRGTVRIAAEQVRTDGGGDVVRLSIREDAAGGSGAEPARPAVDPVSAAIVARHGGRLDRIARPDGSGFAIVMELPVKTPSRAAGAAGSAAAPGQPLPVSAGAASPSAAVAARTDDLPPQPATQPSPPSPISSSIPQRILVLDDEPSIRDFLVRVLRRGGYEAIAAVDGASAVELVRADPPRAILCDYRMAGMSGIAFHEAIAAIDPGLARRFAFMSGDVDNAELHEFALTRGIALLAKPFDIESISRTVSQIAGR